MEQKFVSFDDALEKLSISAERLNELREHGQLRAYRDGASWKFRSDEIESMATEGVPELPPPSDIGLVSPGDLVEASPLEKDEGDELELDLELAEEPEVEPQAAEQSDLELQLDDTDALSVGSELELEGMDDDDTVTSSESEIELALDPPDDQQSASDSILLSEEELGESVSGSPSTIIGKKELESADDDLQLASDDELAEQSDVSLAPPTGTSDVLSSGIASSGVLDDLTQSSGGMSAFEDLEEIDLSAESSRILSPEEAALPVKEASKEEESVTDSDLTLDEEESEMGSTDVPLEELELVDADADEGSGSELDLDGIEDVTASDSDGSDITLDSGDSGINLVSPSDSGLALDDIPLDMGGSAILSSLSLEGSDPEISLIGDEPSAAGEGEAQLQTDEDFQLTPLSEQADKEDGDSSSQVIAVDVDIEEMAEGPVADLEEVGFTEDAGDEVVLTEDFGGQTAEQIDIA